jgi:hypothetical protein
MPDREIYRYEKYNFRVITLLLALIGLVFLFNGEYIVAAICIVLAALLAFSYQGVLIDPDGQRYMKYDRFLHFRIGSWEGLSTPSYVTIVRIKLSNRRTAPSPIVAPEDKRGARAFKVNLVVEGDERFIPICHGSLEKMTDEALRLGKSLQLRVLDYSTHEKKWIL